MSVRLPGGRRATDWLSAGRVRLVTIDDGHPETYRV